MSEKVPTCRRVAEARNSNTTPVVIYNSGGIGDQLLALPALRALQYVFDTSLRVLCVPGVGGLLFSRLPKIQSVETRFFYNHGGKVTGIGLPTLDREPSRGQAKPNLREKWTQHSPWTFDPRLVASQLGYAEIIISLTPWHSKVFEQLCEEIRPLMTVAYSPGHTVSLECNENRHFSDECFACPFSIDSTLMIERFVGAPIFSERTAQRARKILRHISQGRRILGVHCETKPDKLWPEQAFCAVVESFLARNPEFIAILVGTCFEHVWRNSPRVFPCIPLDLATSMALIAHCDLFLGVDSCMVHCADLHNVPSVGLFLSLAARRYGLRFATGETLTERSMDLFRRESVLEALETVVASIKSINLPPKQHVSSEAN